VLFRGDWVIKGVPGGLWCLRVCVCMRERDLEGFTGADLMRRRKTTTFTGHRSSLRLN